MCDSTVAYLFLIDDSLPLADIWAEYFEGCDPGSVTAVVDELLVEDYVRVVGWAGVRNHLARPFYSGMLRIPEDGVFISLAEQNRLAEVERQRKRSDSRSQLERMAKYSEYESDTEYESD